MLQTFERRNRSRLPIDVSSVNRFVAVNSGDVCSCFPTAERMTTACCGLPRTVAGVTRMAFCERRATTVTVCVDMVTNRILLFSMV